MSNTLKTTLLLGLLTALIMWFGQFFGGGQGMMMAFVFAAVMNFGSYWFSDKMVLRMYGASAQPEHARRNPDAEAVHHPARRRERLRYRTKSESCRRRRDPGNPADHVA